MELPINVIMTLFIVVAVGVLVITFAVEMIAQAEDEAKLFGGFSPDEKNRIIEVTTITSSQVAFAAVECFKEFYGVSFADEYCTVLISQGANYTIDQPAIYSVLASYPALFDNDSVAGVGNPAELNMYFTVANGATSNTILIKWLGSETKVEVKT